jgi:anti-anti-sigma factor
MGTDKVVELKPGNIGMAKAGPRTVLTPRESLTYKTCDSLRAVFDDCLAESKIEIVLDCKAVSFMDSKALELLLTIQDELRPRGGMLKLVGLNAVCRDIFLATRLINVLHVYEDIFAAIRGQS